MSEAQSLRPASTLPAVSPHANPVRGRINAVFFDVMSGYMHWKYAPLKQQLFANLPHVVVEIGAGAGANFRYFPRGTRVIAIEPNPHMHARLARSARRWGIDLEDSRTRCRRHRSARGLRRRGGLQLGSVHREDPERAVRQVRRILRPGGRFLCIEHVAALPRSALGRLQRWVRRPWQWFFEGCHTHRNTGAVLRRAGFHTTDIRPFTWRSAFLPVRPQIAAVCVE